MIKKALLAIMFCQSFAAAQGQIVEIPLNENPTLNAYLPIFLENTASLQFRGPNDTLSIPFLEDFNYEELYPSPLFWQDQHAYVNKGFGINPPSLGVATLDGLAADGTAYANTGYGIADYLTSKPIDLGSKTPADNVFLSFFYQAQGFGDKPEVVDSLVIEFKNNQGNWVSMDRIAGLTSAQAAGGVPPFAQKSLPINATQFLYKGFQFRFKNYATLTGSVDHWHIDYVRITQNATPSGILNDIAFTRPTTPILRNYTAMPWRHFQNHKADEVALGYRISLENHFSTQQNINPSKIILEDDETKTVLFQDNILSFNEPPIPLGNMNVGKATVEKTFDAGTQLPAIINALNTLDNEEKAVVNTFYIVNPSNQDGTQTATLRNDTAKAQAIFDNYFAYDDGSAELALVGARLGDQVAVKFRANVPDTLRAVQLFIPHILGSVTSQRFNLKVWLNDLNSTPAFKLDFVKPVYVDSLGGWTTYSLDTTPLALPVGDFYIGWQQALDPPSPNQAIPVGYDRNNPDKVVNNFMNIGNGWQLLTSGTAPINDGAVMIRAIVGDFTPFTSETKEIKAPVFAKVYPNPADDVLFVEMTSDLNAYQYRIFNVAGQLVKAGNASENIDIAALVTGFYVLELQHKTNYSKLHHKFVKR